MDSNFCNECPQEKAAITKFFLIFTTPSRFPVGRHDVQCAPTGAMEAVGRLAQSAGTRVHRLLQWESPARLRTAEERLGKKQQRAVQ